jgi:hypothetical protein
MWYIKYVLEYSHRVKAIRNEILSPVAMWIELEDIMLSKVSQKQKDKYHMFSLIRGS